MAMKLNPQTGLYEDDGQADPNAGIEGPGRPGSVASVPTQGTGFGTPTGDPNPKYDTGNPYAPGGDVIFPNAPLQGGSVNAGTPNPNLPNVPPADPGPATTAPPTTPPATTDPGAGPTGPGGPTGPIGATTPGSQSMADLVNSKVRDLLNTPQTLDTSALLASPEMAAERLQNQRSTERQVADSAEHAAYSGLLGTGGEEGVLRGIKAKQGETDTFFMGQLATQFRQRQIDELKFGIQTAVQMGQFDKAQELQRQLGQLSADTSRQNTQDQVGLGYANLDVSANNAALLAALGL